MWGGGGKSGYIESWRNTSNGIEATAALYNDALLVLDELGQCDPSAAGEVAYMLANGSGKGRATRSGDGRKRTEWRVLFLSSGEIDLETLIQQSGLKIKAGQEIRMIDIPADAERSYGLFEDIHNFQNSQEFADNLRELSNLYYGTPILEFLTKVTEEIDLAIGIAKTSRREFVESHIVKGSSSEVGRVASRFGIVAAAGELAIKLGVVPWRKGEAYEAASICFKSWLNNRGGVGAADLDRALTQVRTFFSEQGVSRFPKVSEDGNQTDLDRTIKRAGFRKGIEGGGTKWLVFPDVFRQEICKGFDYKAVERQLIELGHLIPSRNGNATTPQSLPELKKTRVYVIHSSLLEHSVPTVPDVPEKENRKFPCILGPHPEEQDSVFSLFRSVPFERS